jgi:DNA-binding transcriptional ArsR family regulator
MARARTTLDPFKELPVNEIVELLGWPQPMISKHLGVLKKVGLVSERRAGRQRLYRVNGEKLKSIQDWIKPFESLWQQRFDRLDDYLKELQAKNKKSTDDADNA